MSIVGYAGLPGTGKTYGVVENVIIPALDSGRHIITNIPLKVGRLTDDYPQGKITLFDNREAEDNPAFFSLEEHPGGVIWIIDEAWRFWKSGMKSVNIPQNQKEFFTEHRHMVGEDGRTNEIVLVTQDLQQLCSFVRSLVEETYRAVKLTAIGQSNRYRVDVFQGGVTGQRPGTPMRQLYGKYKPEIYQYYKSHTKNKTDFAAGMEEKADNRANVLKHPLIKFGIPAAAIVMAVGVYQVYGFFTSHTEEEPVPATQTTPNTQQSLPDSQQQPLRQRRQPEQHQGRAEHQVAFEIEDGWLPLSDKWRIVGEVNGVYWIWGDSGTRKVHSRICARTQRTGEPYCVIGGKLVTYYSFKEPSREPDEVRARGYDLKPGSDDA